MYRSRFWEHTRGQIERLRAGGSSEELVRAGILDRFLQDSNVMNFIILLSAVPFRAEPRFRRDALHRAWDVGGSELVENWAQIANFRHFGWLLHFSN